MKVVLVKDRTSVPGYFKWYLRFIKPATSLERKIVKALAFSEPVYLGGTEHKIISGKIGYSLYLGRKPEIKALEIAKEFTPAAIKKRVEAYKEECRCGTKFKNEKLLKLHQKRCTVLASLGPLFSRIDAALGKKKDDSKGKSRKKQKRSDTATQTEKLRRKKIARKVARSLPRRKSRSRP
jgi:hypothetical protein